MHILLSKDTTMSGMSWRVALLCSLHIKYYTSVNIILILLRYLGDEGQRSSAIVGPENNQISSSSKWTVKKFSV